MLTFFYVLAGVQVFTVVGMVIALNQTSKIAELLERYTKAIYTGGREVKESAELQEGPGMRVVVGGKPGEGGII